MSFATAAAEHFAQVRVIAAIGEDQWSDTIWASVLEAGVVACFQQHPGHANGVVVMVRDAGTPNNPQGATTPTTCWSTACRPGRQAGLQLLKGAGSARLCAGELR